jgi:MFS family permease
VDVEQTGRIPALRIGVLGIITITVYGSWYYSFGVLLDPIILDTGWEEQLLATAFAASLLVGGMASLAGGWLLDRFGSRVTFGLGGILGLLAFQTAAASDSSLVFALAGAIGGGTFSALGFYHITQTAAIRISPGVTNKAIAVLTIWGAFASAIFMPLAAWLDGQVGWRTTLRLLTAMAVVALGIGAALVDTRVDRSSRRQHLMAELKQSLRAPSTRSFVIAVGLVGIGTQTILIYQVPAMTAAGLSLTAASFWAGFRGFSQLGGRLPLMPILGRLGTINSLRLAITTIAVGGLVLALAGSPWLAAVYALLAGFGIGALSPLQGMHARDVFGSDSLGTAMGLLFGSGVPDSPSRRAPRINLATRHRQVLRAATPLIGC